MLEYVKSHQKQQIQEIFMASQPTPPPPEGTPARNKGLIRPY